jgi:hypothetical protein
MTGGWCGTFGACDRTPWNRAAPRVDVWESTGTAAMTRPLLAAAFAVVALIAALPLSAQPAARIDPLYSALGLPELLEIMREEGMGYGRDLENDMFPGQGRAPWAATVARIYNIDRMEQSIARRLDAELDDAEIAAILAFFETERGARIVTLETAARRAMLDESVEDAAREAWYEIEAEGGRRWELMISFAEANDLVESNVAGAMTSNYAFYMGLIEGGAFEMGEEMVLFDVWSQEEKIRSETVDWVYSFLTLAYRSLDDEELAAYVDFALTPEGQALNSALFGAFNEMFVQISRELGVGAARYLSGQDI